MSLLLDALKKAADDKLQKSQSPDANETSDTQHVTANSRHQNANDTSTSIELDLDLKTDESETTSTTASTTDDYPQVSEDAIPRNSAPVESNKFDISENRHSIHSQIDRPDKARDKELSLEEIDNNHSVVNSAKNKTENIPNTAGKPEAVLNPLHSQTQQAEKHTASRIESEQALSALINKSNQYSRRETLKKYIGLGILAALILVASGAYFYIQLQTTSQNIYLTQNDDALNKAAVQTIPSTPEKIRPPVNSPITSPTVPQVTDPVNQNIRKVAVVKPPQIKPALVTTTPAKPFNIVHTKKIHPVHLLVSDAYAAFHAQQYRQSETLYKQALIQEPKNRDALLGLAAIGIKEKRYEYARQKYQYLLRMNPADSFAVAGLSGIEKHVDASLSESQLKFMLKQQPDAAHLYFALGAHYSSQLKWPEAQSAYFSAWSADNKNADYCYNLAISLDHLKKKEQALNFYKLSLQLMQTSGGNFSQTDTEDRIRRLQVSIQ